MSSSADPSGDPSKEKSKPFAKLRNTFIAGLAIVIPGVATILILGLGLDLVDYLTQQTFAFLGLRNRIPHFEVLGVRVVPLSILVGVIMAAGLFATHAIGRSFFGFFDRLVLRVPLVSTIYSASKQVVDTLRTFEGTHNFQYVVYIDYPAPGCRLIGFVTGRFHEPHLNRSITTVFLPTSPNPITGFVVAVDSDKVMECRLSVEEATKLIVSAGLVAPSPVPFPVVRAEAPSA